VGPQRPSGITRTASEPPARSGVDPKRVAETLRPRARGKANE
jgi:hypothetical protein